MLGTKMGTAVLAIGTTLLAAGCAAPVSPEGESVERADEAVSANDGAGWTAYKATYDSGAFVQLNQVAWVENNADGHHAFREVGRDQWSVYLQATDRAGVSVQLDYWTHQVKYSGPGYSSPVVLHTIITEDRVKGWAASRVTYDTGAFVQLDPTTWVENNGDGLHTFAEVARDEWSVYLHATDRAGVDVQLDLWTMKVFYQGPGSGGRVVLHAIVAAEPARLGGWAAREVLYASGRFTETGTGAWTEINGDGAHAFRELGRDEWSVYLTATDRANVSVQLDLWTLQVKYLGPGSSSWVVLYGVTGAR